jgi:hypothetical protein
VQFIGLPIWILSPPNLVVRRIMVQLSIPNLVVRRIMVQPSILDLVVRRIMVQPSILDLYSESSYGPAQFGS